MISFYNFTLVTLSLGWVVTTVGLVLDESCIKQAGYVLTTVGIAGIIAVGL